MGYRVAFGFLAHLCLTGQSPPRTRARRRVLVRCRAAERGGNPQTGARSLDLWIESMAAIGWYGPLIDLARAGSHVDDLVQLLVFVHHTQPVVLQKSSTSKGGTITKTKIQVSDDTRTYFSVSLWPKHMGSVVVAGDVLLLQNVKIIRFRDSLEATTVDVSLLLMLVRSHELGAFEGVDELLLNVKLEVGHTTKEKLKRVVDWVWHTESALQHGRKVDSSQGKLMNWKAVEEKNPKICSSISELVAIADSCNVKLYGSTSELLLPATCIYSEAEDTFVSYKSLVKMTDSEIMDHLIGTGCKLCGALVVSRSIMEQNRIPLYCQNSSNYVHKVCIIYKPFMLNVWDKTGQIPIIVKNKAAEILFGNITAEMVHRCYKKESENASNSSFWSWSHKRQKNNESRNKIHRIWLIILKLLLQQGGKNSPFHFEIAVDREKGVEAGRFELTSITMPMPSS